MKTHTDIRRFIDIFRVKWRLRSYGLVGTMLILFTLLAVPRPAAACSAFNPFCWAGELVDYVWDDLRDLKSLTWDVVTLDYRDVWKDVRTIVDNQIGFRRVRGFILGPMPSSGTSPIVDPPTRLMPILFPLSASTSNPTFDRFESMSAAAD